MITKETPEVKIQYDEPYQFNLAPDNVGLALEHPDYGKKSCRRCDGRLFMRLFAGDGYSTTELDAQEKNGRKRLRSELHACVCVHRGYQKVRFAFARIAMSKVPTYILMEDATDETMIEVKNFIRAKKPEPLSEEGKKLLEAAVAAANTDVLEQNFAQFKGVAPAVDAA